MKKFITIIFILCTLIFSRNLVQSQSLKGNDIVGISNFEYIGSEVVLSEDGNIMVTGAKFGTLVRAYNFVSGNWAQLGSDITYSDLFVSSVKIDLSSDGQTIICGYFDADPLGDFSQLGLVKVFRYNSGNWQQLGSDFLGETQVGLNGYAVSISSDGNTIAFSEYGNNLPGFNHGKVKVFNYDGANWNLKGAPLVGVADPDLCGFGCDLNSDGNRIAIGAPGNSSQGSSRGQVRIYEFNSGNWSQLGGSINGIANFDQIGKMVKLNSAGDRVAFSLEGSDVGALNGGEVKVYSYSDGTWTQMGDGITGIQVNENLGRSISISGAGDRLAICSPSRTAGGIFGIAYLLHWDGNSWSTIFNITGDVSHKLVRNIAISSNGLNIAIGNSSYDTVLPSSFKGRVHVYENLIDTDSDDVDDLIDNCPLNSNFDQQDSDEDEIGEVCDNCPNNSNSNQMDTDNDGLGDACDECPNDPNKTSPGACGCGNIDTDSDGDTVADCIDNCSLVANSNQEDEDCDGIGDICDVCQGGDDTIDNDNNGLPDCKFPPTSYSNVDPSWQCGNNKVYVCHHKKTKCSDYDAAQNHIDHGDYLGPCGGANCNEESIKDPPNIGFLGDEYYKVSYNRFYEDQSELRIYPNPAKNILNVTLSNFLAQKTSNDKISIRIMNSISKEVYSTTIINPDNIIKLNISQIPSGLYIIKVHGNSPEYVKSFLILD